MEQNGGNTGLRLILAGDVGLFSFDANLKAAIASANGIFRAEDLEYGDGAYCITLTFPAVDTPSMAAPAPGRLCPSEGGAENG
jgi:hypothetical protein